MASFNNVARAALKGVDTFFTGDIKDTVRKAREGNVKGAVGSAVQAGLNFVPVLNLASKGLKAAKLANAAKQAANVSKTRKVAKVAGSFAAGEQLYPTAQAIGKEYKNLSTQKLTPPTTYTPIPTQKPTPKNINPVITYDKKGTGRITLGENKNPVVTYDKYGNATYTNRSNNIVDVILQRDKNLIFPNVKKDIVIRGQKPAAQSTTQSTAQQSTTQQSTTQQPAARIPVKPRLEDMIEPSKPEVRPQTPPNPNVRGSTGRPITLQPPRTEPSGTGSKIDPNTNTLKNTATPNTSTNISKPPSQNVTPVIDSKTGQITYQTETPKTQTQDNNWYPHYGTDGRFLGYYRYPQQATTPPPAKNLETEEEAVSRYNREEIERMYQQNLPNRLRLQAEEENYRQQQLNAARASDLQQQVSIIDARSTGVPPWMIAAKQRYEAGLGRSQALGAVREQDIRDLLSQRQMAARGRAAGMVGGRSTGILGSSLTGARRGYDLGIRNETLRRIEEQAALKERYDEYLSEAARQASLQQLEDAQERANIVQQIRSLGGSI